MRQFLNETIDFCFRLSFYLLFFTSMALLSAETAVIPVQKSLMEILPWDGRGAQDLQLSR